MSREVIEIVKLSHLVDPSARSGYGVLATMGEANPRQKIANLVKAGRKELGLTQAGLARELGMSPASISRIEAGSSGIDIDDWKKFCSLVGIPNNTELYGHIEHNVTLPRAANKMRVARAIGQLIHGKPWTLPWKYQDDCLTNYDQELVYLFVWRILSSGIRPVDAIVRIAVFFRAITLLSTLAIESVGLSSLIISLTPAHPEECQAWLCALNEVAFWAKEKEHVAVLHPECTLRGADRCLYDIQVGPSTLQPPPGSTIA